MADPYEIMELNSSASDDEVKQAYRKLAKKYHPDLNPGDQMAALKMQKINAAYEQIKTARQGGPAYQQASGGSTSASGQQRPGQGADPFGQGDPFGEGGIFWQFREFFEGSQQQQQQQQSTRSPRLQAAYHFVRNRQYQEALRVLAEVDEREAEWFFLSAIASGSTGNRVTALNHAREALRLEPGNEEYQSLLAQFEQGHFVYREAGAGFGMGLEGVGKFMMRLFALQMIWMFFIRPWLY